MTAAGFGLPFGVWFLWQLLQPDSLGAGKRSASGSPMAGGGLFGCAARGSVLALMFFYNRAITGDGLLSPYQLYNDTYTPRHVYGFNNVTRGERRVGPRVIGNLRSLGREPDTAPGTLKRTKNGWNPARWTLGPIPLAMAAVVFLIAVLWRTELRWKLIAASVVSLHVVHVPYWFVGIMGWHYVFETAPLLLLLFAITSRRLVAMWSASGRVVMPIWWAALIASAVVTNWIAVRPVLVASADRRRRRGARLRATCATKDSSGCSTSSSRGVRRWC